MNYKSARRLVAMLVLSIATNIMGMSVSAYEQTAITGYASFNVDAVTKHSIALVNDGQPRTGMATDEKDLTWDFPVHITIDFGERMAELSEIRLNSMYGNYMGISTFDVEYKDGDDWKAVDRELKCPWKYNDSTNEILTFHFYNKTISNEFRLVIKEARRREFRLDEIELFGQMKDLANPINIISLKPIYVTSAINMPISAPTNVEVLSSDGETTLQVQWPDAKYANEGAYILNGTIPYYESKPEAIVDVYDFNKDISVFSDNWAENLVTNAVKGGLLSNIEIDVDRRLNRADAAKLIFRKLIKTFSINDTSINDVDTSDNFYYIYKEIANHKCFDIMGEFNKEKAVTRMEMLKACIVACGYDNAATETTIPFTDITQEEEKYVKIGLENGLIREAETFRPNDEIVLGEALAMLSGTKGGRLDVEFTDNRKLVRNPDMGLFSYFYDNDPNNYDIAYGADTTFEDIPEFSIVFMRFAWAFLEPRKGEYDFSMIDSVINRYAATGRQVAFRISTAETGFPYATPSWVYDEGCQYYRWDNSGVNVNGENLMVDFNDPIFLKYQRKLTEELAKRYDGNPNIAFVEIGNVGVWGEGHTYTSGIMYSLDTAKECIDMYVDNFHKTYVHVNNLTQGYAQLEDYCIEKGIGWRNDSFYVNGPSLHTYDNQVEKYWKTNPVAMEPQHWDRLVGWNQEECLKSFDTNHPTFFGLHGYIGNIMYTDGDFVKKAALRIGYRFIPETVSLSSTVNAHGKLSLDILWKNNGCAPSYKDYYPALTLKNKNGAIETVMVDPDFSMSNVEPDGNALEKASLRLNAVVPGGEYDAYLSVGNLDGMPKIELPINGDDGNKRYYIGKVIIRPDYEIKASQEVNKNALNIDFSVYNDVFGEYKFWASTVLMYDDQNGTGRVNGELSVSLSDYKETFLRAMNNKERIQITTPEFIPKKEVLDRIKGRELTVIFQIYNDGIAKGDNVYMLVGNGAQRPIIGKAVFDENGVMTFTPVQD